MILSLRNGRRSTEGIKGLLRGLLRPARLVIYYRLP